MMPLLLRKLSRCPLLQLAAAHDCRATQRELARQVRYLKVENETLRSKLAGRGSR